MSMLLSQGLSARLMKADLPKGLKTSKLTATDLAKLKQYWLTYEMRSDASWARFETYFDPSRQFSVDPRSKGVVLPVAIKAGAREEVMLLIRSGNLEQAPPGPLATVTFQQSTPQGDVVGGSTFVFKPPPESV